MHKTKNSHKNSASNSKRSKNNKEHHRNTSLRNHLKTQKDTKTAETTARTISTTSTRRNTKRERGEENKHYRILQLPSFHVMSANMVRLLRLPHTPSAHLPPYSRVWFLYRNEDYVLEPAQKLLVCLPFFYYVYISCVTRTSKKSLVNQTQHLRQFIYRTGILSHLYPSGHIRQ